MQDDLHQLLYSCARVCLCVRRRAEIVMFPFPSIVQTLHGGQFQLELHTESTLKFRIKEIRFCGFSVFDVLWICEYDRKMMLFIPWTKNCFSIEVKTKSVIIIYRLGCRLPLPSRRIFMFHKHDRRSRNKYFSKRKMCEIAIFF